MTLNTHRMRRSLARVGVASLPMVLAGCSPRPLVGGHAAMAPSATERPSSAPAASANVVAARSASRKDQASLYARLGGADGIAAFTDDFLGRATNDPVIVPFFKGLTTADLQRIRQHVIELLCSATGGPCVYSGKDMKTVHAQMEIDNDAWNAFTGHLNETVARFKIQDRERNELVAIIASLRKDIVSR